MADHRALGRIGWVFAAITAAVLMSAAMAVSHADQRPDQGVSRVAAVMPSASADGFASLFHAR